jgi:hypothetical protein
MFGVPPICDPAYPAVLERQPDQAQHCDGDRHHARGHALVVVSGAEGRKASDTADHAGNDQQVSRPVQNVNQRLTGERPRRP